MIRGHIVYGSSVIPVCVRPLRHVRAVSVKRRLINTANKTNFVPARHDKMFGRRIGFIENAFQHDLGAYQRLLAHEVVFFKVDTFK